MYDVLEGIKVIEVAEPTFVPAGAWELLSSTATAGWTPVEGIVTPFSRTISDKAQILGCWLADKQRTLQRSLLLFSKETNGKTYKIRSLEFERFR